MRTYDKLIATIHTRQGAAGLHACLGCITAGRGCSAECFARPSHLQDDSTDNVTL